MLKINTLVDYLQRIQSKYGNLNVDINVLSGEHYDIQSLCIDTNCDEDDELPRLYIEIDMEENKSREPFVYIN